MRFSKNIDGSHLVLMERLIFCHLLMHMCTLRCISYLLILIFLWISYHPVSETNFWYISVFLSRKPCIKESPKKRFRYQVILFKMNLEVCFEMLLLIIPACIHYSFQTVICIYIINSTFKIMLLVSWYPD